MVMLHVVAMKIVHANSEKMDDEEEICISFVLCLYSIQVVLAVVFIIYITKKILVCYGNRAACWLPMLCVTSRVISIILMFDVLVVFQLQVCRCVFFFCLSSLCHEESNYQASY